MLFRAAQFQVPRQTAKDRHQYQPNHQRTSLPDESLDSGHFLFFFPGLERGSSFQSPKCRLRAVFAA